MYYVNSDSINDYGKIEYSLNNGSWININDNTTFWGSPNSLPVLTGNSNGWKSFNVIFHTNSYDGDTLRFRFTFISDNIQTNKDGLMFDNISIDDQSEGIKEFGYDYIQSKVFPDPVSDNLNIELENKTSLIYQLTITDTKGNIVKSSTTVKSSSLNINIKDLPSGIYFYNLTNTTDKKYTSGKFIKQ